MAQDGKITVDPSLGPRGYIQDEMQVGVQMFARYYIAHHSQDLHYERSIASLNKDIQEAGGDLDELVNIVRNTLSRYYLDAFKTVNLNVKVKHLSDSEARVTLVISIRFGTTKMNDLRYGIKTPFKQHKVIRYSHTGEHEVYRDVSGPA